jgi:hypothetical protein
MNEKQREVPPGRYLHYKGNLYEVIGVARHSETEEEYVVYRALYGAGELWIRPKAMFLDTVERNGTRTARFTYVGATPADAAYS